MALISGVAKRENLSGAIDNMTVREFTCESKEELCGARWDERGQGSLSEGPPVHT